MSLHLNTFFFFFLPSPPSLSVCKKCELHFGLFNWLLQDLLEKIAPTWMNVSLKMKDDPETDKVFGWVLEM